MSQNSLFEFTVQSAKEQPYPLSQFKNKVVIVVNVASECGFTPQYDGLELIYKNYQKDGLVILGFPCNQFGGQEPGSNEQIQEFCRMNHGVTFPVLAKIEVNGDDTAPVYQWLKAKAPGLLGTEAIKWNFTKFLIGRDGQVLDRFSPQATPESMSKAIEKALAAK